MLKWLLDGEQVEVRTRAHARVLVWPITVGLMLIMMGSAALAKLQPGPYAQWAPEMDMLREPAIVLLVLGIGLMLLLYPVRRVWRWAGTRYFLTSRRLEVRRGPFGRVLASYNLEQVQEIRPVQKWRQKMVGSGDLQLHLHGGAVRTISEVPNLAKFNRATLQAWTNVFSDFHGV